jgi:hypothetical protein
MNQLISALVERHVISGDNVITASYTVQDSVGRTLKKVGNFGLINVEKSDDNIQFTLQHVIEKKRVKVNDEAIIAIDGMDIRRYADVYDINADGSNKKIGKKRGRKPKVR